MAYIKDSPLDIQLETGIDLTGATELYINLKSPSGKTTTHDAVVYGAASNGVIEAEIIFDEEGMWRIWAVVDNSEGQAFDQYVIDVPTETQNKIVSVEFVRWYLGLTTTEYDGKIAHLIPIVEKDYQRIQNKSFWTHKIVNGSYRYSTYDYPVGSDVVAAEMIGWKLFGRSPSDGYKNIESEKIGDYSVSYKQTSGYPKEITNSIQSFVRFL